MAVELGYRPMATDVTQNDIGITLHGTTEEITRRAESGHNRNPTLDGLPNKDELEALLSNINIPILGFEDKTRDGQPLPEEELLRLSREDIKQLGMSLVPKFGVEKAEDFIKRQARQYTRVEEKPV